VPAPGQSRISACERPRTRSSPRGRLPLAEHRTDSCWMASSSYSASGRRGGERRPLGWVFSRSVAGLISCRRVCGRLSHVPVCLAGAARLAVGIWILHAVSAGKGVPPPVPTGGARRKMACGIDVDPISAVRALVGARRDVAAGWYRFGHISPYQCAGVRVRLLGDIEPAPGRTQIWRRCTRGAMP
jgi:hypothetical protein